MNIEVNELDELLNYLETTSLEPHDNYTSEFTYKDQKILYKYIKDLQQERDKYKSIVDKAIDYLEKFIPIDDDTILFSNRQREHLLKILKDEDTVD